MAADEEDPVIQEIDIYVTNQLASYLYLLQFPLRSATRSYEFAGARIKPNADKIELDIPLDTTSANYDKARGEEFSNLEKRDQGIRRKCLDKLTLRSQNVLCKSEFLIGVFADGAPMDVMVQ